MACPDAVCVPGILDVCTYFEIDSLAAFHRASSLVDDPAVSSRVGKDSV